MVDWSALESRRPLYLYAGSIFTDGYAGWVGLSLDRHDECHVRHDITNPIPLADCTVGRFQSEDVFEHIEQDRIPAILVEIHRVLEPGGLFRWSMPDYGCDVLRDRSQTDEHGNIVFDPGGGGRRRDGRVVDGGHVWFPTFEVVDALIDASPFTDVRWLHHFRSDGSWVTEPIDFSKGLVRRVPDHDERVRDPWRPLSLVVDLVK